MSKGFTLIEILLVLGLISALVVSANDLILPVFQKIACYKELELALSLVGRTRFKSFDSSEHTIEAQETDYLISGESNESYKKISNLPVNGNFIFEDGSVMGSSTLVIGGSEYGCERLISANNEGGIFW